jgi:hypothetical protein
MVRNRLTILVFAVLGALVVAGCGGSSSGSSGSDLASVASPGSVVFAEGALQPKGEMKSNLDSIAKTLTGEASLGAFVASKLESSAQEEGESLDFSRDVEPWLGARGAIAFEKIVDGELSEPLIAVQTTNTEAAQDFIDRKTAEAKTPSKDASYEGVEFKVGGTEDDAVGLIGETLVLANSEKEFKAAIDASQGDSLAGEDRFQETVDLASDGSFADVYIDVGSMVEQSQGETDALTEGALQSAGIDPSEATAVASVIPNSDQIEIEVNSELGGKEAPSGNASKLLGSLPASSFAALSFAGFNEQLEEAVDNLDEEGVPPDLKPGELKSSLKQAGVDIEKIVASLEEAAIFAEGSDKASLGGAMVVTAKSSEAADAVGSLGTLLRAAKVPGITALSGRVSGFSIQSGELGNKALVVVGKGDRVAVGYGLAQALSGLNAGSAGATLSGTPEYKAAVAALGKTPISGFVDGAAALKLAEALVPRSKTDFWEAVPYLSKIEYVGIGSGPSDESATAKLIVGIGK